MKMAPCGAIFLQIAPRKRSAGASATNDPGAIRQSFLHGHGAAAGAAEGGAVAIAIDALFPIMAAFGLTDPYADARTFDPDALRRCGGHRDGTPQYPRGSKNEQ